MALDIKITGLDEVNDQSIFDYYEDLAETLKTTYSRAYPNIRDYHFKKLDFTLILKANLQGRCFEFVGIDGEHKNSNHETAMIADDVKVFFKAVI